MQKTSDTAPSISVRIPWIDSAKGLAISLMVLGHTSVPPKASDFIYAFHVPVFIYLSALLNSKGMHSTKRLSHRVGFLIRTYFIFALLSYLFWLLFQRPYGNPIHQEIPRLRPLVGILYGVGSSTWMPQNVSLWFLPFLCSVECLCFFLLRGFARSKVRGLLLSASLGALLLFVSTNGIRLPFSLDSAILALPFYLAGLWSNPRVYSLISAFSDLQKILLALLLFVFIFFSAQVVGTFDLAAVFLGQYPPLVYFQGFLGIFAVFLISSVRGFSLLPFGFVGRNSLTVLGIHSLIDTCLKGVWVRVAHHDMSVLQQSVIPNIFLSVVNLLIVCLCFGWVDRALRNLRPFTSLISRSPR